MKMKKYTEISKELSQLIGNKKVITDSEILASYSKDETSDLSSMPDILVRAESAEDVKSAAGGLDGPLPRVVPQE